MSKVKLLVVEGGGTNSSPYIGGTERIIDLNVTIPENENIVEIIRYDFDTNEKGETRSNDDLQPVVTLSHINGLVGKVLTIVDASFSDPEQRKAAKDLLKDSIYGWYMSQGDMFTDTWRKDKFPNYSKAFDLES